MPDKNDQKHYVRAAYAPDGPSAVSMTALLEEHGIDAFRKGGVKDIYKIGGDVFGEEIMVAPDNLQRAQELLQQYPGSRPPAPSTPFSWKKTILALLAALVLFIVLLFLRGRLMA